MRSCHRLRESLFCLCLIICANKNAVGQNYVFARLTGAPIKTTGWTLQGDAQVGNVTGTGDSELIICRSGYMNSGAIFFNQPINLSKCNRWAAEFDFRMFDGPGADGLAFCFLDAPPSGFLKGSALGIPATANGLKICFDTWNNCIPFDPRTVHKDMPKIEIRWGVGYDDNTTPNFPLYGECKWWQPTRDNSDGKISFIRSPNYSHAKITYDRGHMQVFVNDTLYLTGYSGADDAFDFTGYLGFTAATGGYWDSHAIKNVIIYTEMPSSFAGKSQSFCSADTVQLGGPSNPSYIYSWYPSTGLNDTSISSPSLHLTNSSADSQSFTYYIKTAYSDKPGCASIDSVILKVYPNPIIDFKTPKICLTDAIGQFYDSTWTKDSTTLPFHYQWNFGDPNANAGNPNNSTLQNPTHHYSAARNYQAGLTVTNSKGCTNTGSKIFTVNGAVPKANFSVIDRSGLCSNEPVQIVNNSSVDFGSITKVQIIWGDTAAASYDTFPYPQKVYSHYYPNPISANTANYTIRMISSSGITCEDQIDQPIIIQPSPHVQFNTIPIVCSNASPFNITQAAELTNSAGYSSYSGKGISADGVFDPRVAGVGRHPLLYKFTGVNGCIDSAYQIIPIHASPKINAGNDTSIVIGQPLQLQAVSATASTFHWSPPDYLDNPFTPNPIATIHLNIDLIKYLVTATDPVGCSEQDSIKVHVFKTLPDIFVPTAFTPGNSINNIFRPIPVGISSLQYFRIYNRWGQLVYSTSAIGAGWDGRISGESQATGTFVWVVQGTTYTGKIISKRGTMTLIR